MYYKLFFNDSCSLVYEELIAFHDIVMYILILIRFVVFFRLIRVWFNSSLRKYFLEKNTIEILWTIIPAFILLFLSFPSLSLLYHIDTPLLKKVGKTLIKVVGHQWYWEYSYLIKKVRVTYNSFIEPLNNLNLGGFRLLEVDKPLIVGYNNLISLKGITEDVIHSWSCNSLGIKFDVVPGRLNNFKFVPLVLGVFYGQCSEICGANHRFMPIEVEVVYLN